MASYITGGGNGNTQSVIKYDGIQVGTSQFDIPIPIFWGQRRISYNCVWYNNFQSHQQNSKGKGGGKGSGQYTYTAAIILGLGEGVVDSILNIWTQGSTTNTTTLTKLGLSFFSGTATQTPWSYVETNYPTQALSYSRTAYVASSNFQLGSSASVPDNAFEAVRLNGWTDTLVAPGWTNPTTMVNTPGTDVSMADFLPDFLTNPQYGMGFSSDDIPDLTVFRAYQDGQDLYFSPYLVNQETATDIINRWAQMANTWIYWAGTQLMLVPLGDSAIGAYTPDLTAAYDLGLADFIGEVPVQVTRKSPADCHNRTVIQFTDRTLGYVGNNSEYKDQTLVDEFGLRDNSSTQFDEICNPSVAAIVAQLVGKREAYIRNTYTFSTSYRYIRLLPGSIVTLTEPNEGLNKFRVRITKVDEADGKDGALTLKFEAEELPALIGTYFVSNTQDTFVPQVPNNQVDPGDVNTPGIAEPNSAFTRGTAQLLINASGGANWGGCEVFVAFNGSTSYSSIGEITAVGAQGLLTANLASHADPDLVDTLAVNTTESLTVPQPVTTQDADAFRTLSLISPQPTVTLGVSILPNSGELIAFGDVTTTGAYAANLTYLRRGVYGSTVSSHSTGDQFSLFDVSGTSGTTLFFDLPPQYIGTPISLKLCSFNIFQQAQQDLSTVVEYQYTPTGAGYGGGTGGIPTVPTGLVGASGNGQNTLTWSANPTTDNVTSYTLFAAPGLSQPFGGAVPIYSGLALKFVHSGLGNNAAYTYFVLASNEIGSSSATAGINCTTNTTGSGSVTSVGLTMPAEFSVSNSPVTASGTLAVAKATQAANLVYAGPASGSAAQPTFRALTTADIPSLAAQYLPLTGGTLSGALSVGGSISVSTTVVVDSNRLHVFRAYTVATLPTGVSPYSKAFVTDSTVPITTGLGLAPVGGGTNKVPVYTVDGNSWLIG